MSAAPGAVASFPSALLSALSRDPKRRPFSYAPGEKPPSQPSAVPRPRSVLSCPRVLPLLPAGAVEEDEDEEEEETMIVHRQYNSPLPLYSSESAAEQYRQQMVGHIDDQQQQGFDPRRSHTLQLIQDQQQQQHPGDFFAKVSAAEAPKVPHTPEPAWTENARRRQQRARSQTPYSGDEQYMTQSLPRQQHQQQQQQRLPGDAPKHGYDFGGMDYTGQRSMFDNSYGGGDYWSGSGGRRAKSSSPAPTRPGYQFGGMDFCTPSRQHQGTRFADSRYQGYGPLTPRKRAHFRGSQHDQLNTYESSNIDRVSDLRLIGDTISNQKLQSDHPLDPEQKKYIGTFFTGPTGFSRQHRTVRPVQAPPEPVTYSISAPLLAAPLPNAPPQPRQSQPAAGYRWAEQQKPQVNLTTLLSDEALIAPRNRPVTPPWAHQRNTFYRPTTGPWSSKHDGSAASWSRRAEKTHSAWQAEANRLQTGQAQPWPSAVPVSSSSQADWSSSNQQRSSSRNEETRRRQQDTYNNNNNSLSRIESSSSRQPPVSFEGFDQRAEMAETLPRGSLWNTEANTSGNYRDEQGRNVSYKREVLTSADPGKDVQLLKEEERRVIEQPLEPGVISRHVTTKYYKKKTVTDTKTTTTTTKQ